MKKPVINLSEIQCQPRPAAFAAPGDAAERFDASMGMFSQALGAQQLGYNITCVPPGKRAFPFHNHRVNEEMFFIISGEGDIRIGDTTHPIKANDFIACPAGDENTAHQIINTGNQDLTYLAVSTKLSPEIANYPDSGKFAVLADYPPDENGNPQKFTFISKAEESKGYWDGE